MQSRKRRIVDEQVEDQSSIPLKQNVSTESIFGSQAITDVPKLIPNMVQPLFSTETPLKGNKQAAKIPTPARMTPSPKDLVATPSLIKNEYKDDMDISEDEILYFCKRKLHDSKQILTSGQKKDILNIASNAGYLVDNPTAVAYFCSHCETAVLETDFCKQHQQHYSANMFEHVSKRHKDMGKKYMVIECKDKLQVCRAESVNSHSNIANAMVSDEKIRKIVLALALRLSDRLKAAKHYLELGTNVLQEEEGDD